MLAQEIIALKRDGHTLDRDQINLVVTGLVDGSYTDAQISALAMAILFRGMSLDERVMLSLAMRDSGTVLTWDVNGPVVDKHSTGGVGDNVSLMLAPALAACGAYVPMISGRGLGHTGGTLDKFDSIPGYRTAPDEALLRQVVTEVGCAVIGQTPEIAPADKRFYAIRDVTGTVESIDLITASILSKKLAAGLDALVLDVKSGIGAFMIEQANAFALAESLVTVAKGAGCNTTALLTDMNEPLASAAGNALEMVNAAAFLTGYEIDSRLWDITVAQGGALLQLSGLARDAQDGSEKIADAFLSGRATEVFGRMVAALGGPADFVDRFQSYLPTANIIRDVFPDEAGFVAQIDTRAVGYCVVELGGGRRKVTDQIDYSVGFDQLLPLGSLVGPDVPIARIHARDEATALIATERLKAAYRIDDAPPDIGPAIIDRLN